MEQWDLGIFFLIFFFYLLNWQGDLQKSRWSQTLSWEPWVWTHLLTLFVSRGDTTWIKYHCFVNKVSVSKDLHIAGLSSNRAIPFILCCGNIWDYNSHCHYWWFAPGGGIKEKVKQQRKLAWNRRVGKQLIWPSVMCSPSVSKQREWFIHWTHTW